METTTVPCSLPFLPSVLHNFKMLTTIGGDCSHEIKRRLLLGRKGMTNLDSIFRSRDITLATNVCLVKAMCFFLFLFLFLFFVFPIAHIWM